MNHEEFEALNTAEQEKAFHESPLKERGDLLRHSRDPLRLARSLSVEEMYLLTREMDIDERSELMRYANLPQLFFVSDIECWHGDQVNPVALLNWMATLRMADENKLLQWMVGMDYETVVAGLKKLMYVMKPEKEYPSDELLGDKAYFTLDENYFVFTEQENLEEVRRALEILYENFRAKYVVLLEGVIGELDYEVEEEAFQKRSQRLAERGFSDPETAQSIYKLLTPGELEAYPPKTFPEEEAPIENFEKPHNMGSFLVPAGAAKSYFDEALLFFHDEDSKTLEHLHEEMTWISNKVIACQGIDFSSEEKVRQGVERARALVSFGLEKLSEGDLKRAVPLLREKWLELFFRVAVTELVRMREDANELVKEYWNKERVLFYEFLNTPYDTIFQGAFQILPQYYEAGHKEKHPFRDFRRVVELERTYRAVHQMKAIHGAFLKDASVRKKVLRATGQGQMTLLRFLSQVFAQEVVEGKAGWKELTEAQKKKFCEKAYEDYPSSTRISGPLRENFLAHSFTSEQREQLRPLWALVLDYLREKGPDILVATKTVQVKK